MRAALAYFGLVFAAGFVLGAIRVPLLVPHLGVRWAELLEMPLMLVVLLLAARWVVARFGLAGRVRAALLTGSVALLLLAGAELLLAWLLAGQSPAAYLASRDLVSGSVYLGMLLVFAGLPAVFARRAGAGGSGV